MPWIHQIPASEADGLLKSVFDAVIKRDGRIWHSTRVMSLNPRVLKASMDHYYATMYGDSPLSRVQRELLAAIVSAELGCYY